MHFSPTESETSMYATDAEIFEQFLATTFATYDFQVRNVWDNGEFMTGATVDLIERGTIIHTETFTASSEDAPGPGFSAYGNGRDNHATTLALSYAWAWVESMETPLDERLSPYGDEWQREMMDERVAA